MLRWLRRLLWGGLGLGAVLTVAFVALVVATPQPSSRPSLGPGRTRGPDRVAIHLSRPAAPSCERPAGFAPAAALNARSLATAAWAPFRRAEAGWETYAPLVGRTIRTRCAPATPGFAEALARWRGVARNPAAGVLDAATLQAIGGELLQRRPFVRAMAHGCPPPPAASEVATAETAEGWGGRRIRLHARALAAWRRMRAAAQAELAEVAADPRLLTLVSGFRDPVEEGARCAARACDGLTRAHCSAHRTGMAMDLYLGGAEGADPTSSDDANRLRQSRTPAYRWLVANADRFGFVPYPYEPWHWEWAGPLA